ncbi:SPASM domain-containing protein [Acetivibrio clariflavus]|uniref:SPASM domain-containing protein n=1 Tax=Acetivibrio clariflavus TaxID=288965 RepID=UPI000485EAF3|nr:SPASM domain-containing protein [Acetivibrio clariflavus]
MLINLGILHNCDILGCTSVRDKNFIEGNAKTTPIKEIWSTPDSFSWNRKMTKNKLSGLCRICLFGNRCLGGCSNTRLTIGRKYLFRKKYLKQLEIIEDLDVIMTKARK